MADVRTSLSAVPAVARAVGGTGSACTCSHDDSRMPEVHSVEIEVLIDWYLDAITDAMSGCPERELALSHALRIAELHAMMGEDVHSSAAPDREHGA